MKRCFSYLSFILGLVVFGCSKDVGPTLVSNDQKSPYIVRAQEPVFKDGADAELNELAKSLNKAVRSNIGMRQFIHSEVQLRFDGDYEFLISKVTDSPIPKAEEESSTRSGQDMITFGEMVREYLPETRSGEDILTVLQELYPDLQVAVPVHADEWDPETYTPVVVFVPTDYRENETLTVPGYDAEGLFVEVDAINEPDVPVIVISRNERVGTMRSGSGSTSSSFSPVPPPPPPSVSAPSDLAASQTHSGIVLSWQFNGSAHGFKVWRKGENDTAFTTIAIVPGMTNTGYQDTQVVSGYTYQYYVTAYYQSYQSVPSNMVTAVAPSVVEPLTNFSVIPSGLGLECRWTHGQVPFADVVIEHKGPNAINYSVLSRITDWQTNYCFLPSDKGMRHDFRIYRDNGSSQSDALTDFVYPPYRNTSVASSVYIKRIEYSRGVEGWLRGDAEFDIVATYYDRQSSKIKADSVFVHTSSGDDLSNVFLKEWRYLDLEKDWYSMITIHVIEQDPGDEAQISLDGKLAYKSGNILDAVVAGSYTHVWKEEDDSCGSRDLYYYDNPETVLQFSMYDVRLTLSENP